MKSLLALSLIIVLLSSCTKGTQGNNTTNTDLKYKANGTITFVNSSNQTKVFNADSIHLYSRNLADAYTTDLTKYNCIDISLKPNIWSGDTTMQPLFIVLNQNVNIFSNMSDSFMTNSAYPKILSTNCLINNQVLTSTSFLSGIVDGVSTLKNNVFISTTQKRITLNGDYSMQKLTVTNYNKININVGW